MRAGLLKNLLGLAITGSIALHSAIAQAPTAPPVQREAPTIRFTLNDQFDRPHDTAAYRTHVLVMIYGDRASTDANKSLGERLHLEYHPQAKGLPPLQARQVPPTPLVGLPAERASPNVFVEPVAVIGKVPGVVKNIIRNQFRRGAGEVPVWLDFEDRMKTSFGMVAEVPNVVVLDATGRLRYRFAGDITETHYKRMTQMIDQLRKEAAGQTP